ncbi:MAG: hypothetical protein BI182_15400 [Acetobacterium sp. MES1]|uniref:restriction endonuclease subunit S n=1 Tax=Acetobacterium sp. MES1 TaxID=1899015 RepID=UPI000B9CF6B4|nr:restriction endonuclease subunit S [Acetobacterium sp. MES1]OXS26464.1 MAG: hypothetical protein BI182_15400 [Acetobacterium sp. MES1]
MAKKKQVLTVEEKLAAALVREDEQPYEVPGNWVWTRLDKLKNNENGFFDGDWILSQNMDINGEVRLIQLSDIGIGSFLDKSSKHINSEKFDELGCKELIEGDILISRMAEPIVRSFIFPKLTYKCITVVDVAVLRCNNNLVNIKFANYLFNTPWFTELAMSIARGTTRVRITRKNLGELPIPLPPLAEQQRIVDRIESLFDQLDQAKALIQEALDSFETRKAAILHQAFTGALTKKWREEHIIQKHLEYKKLIDITTKITDGFHNSPSPQNIGYPYVMAGNVKETGINFNSGLFMDEKNHRELYNKAHPKKGDILLVNIGAGSGTSAVIDVDFEFSFKNSAILKLKEDVNPYYVNYYLQYTKEKTLAEISKGGAQPFLSLKVIKEMKIMMLPFVEQNQVVCILDDLFAKEQAAKDLCDQIDQIDTIKKTILGKAFRGELGTNVAGEESAVELLAAFLTG